MFAVHNENIKQMNELSETENVSHLNMAFSMEKYMKRFWMYNPI